MLCFNELSWPKAPACFVSLAAFWPAQLLQRQQCWPRAAERQNHQPQLGADQATPRLDPSTLLVPLLCCFEGKRCSVPCWGDAHTHSPCGAGHRLRCLRGTQLEHDARVEPSCRALWKEQSVSGTTKGPLPVEGGGRAALAGVVWVK